MYVHEKYNFKNKESNYLDSVARTYTKNSYLILYSIIV